MPLKIESDPWRVKPYDEHSCSFMMINQCWELVIHQSVDQYTKAFTIICMNKRGCWSEAWAEGLWVQEVRVGGVSWNLPATSMYSTLINSCTNDGNGYQDWGHHSLWVTQTQPDITGSDEWTLWYIRPYSRRTDDEYCSQHWDKNTKSSCMVQLKLRAFYQSGKSEHDVRCRFYVHLSPEEEPSICSVQGGKGDYRLISVAEQSEPAGSNHSAPGGLKFRSVKCKEYAFNLNTLIL